MRTLLGSLAMLLAPSCGGGAATQPGPEEPLPPTSSPPEGSGAPGACPMEGGGDAPDTADGAMLLQPGDNAGCFAMGDTKDTYALEAPKGQYTLYKITYEGAPAAQGCFELMDANKQVAKWSDRCAQAPGGSKRAWALAAPGGRWFLELKDLTGTAGKDPRGYHLKVEATAIPDADEPNDKPADAKPVTLGQAKESWFFDSLNGEAGDQDLFKVDVPKAGTLVVGLENVDPTVQFAVTITDGKGQRVVEKGAPNEGANLTLETKVKPGSYTVAIRNIAGRGTPAVGKDDPPRYATQPYKLTVSMK